MYRWKVNTTDKIKLCCKSKKLNTFLGEKHEKHPETDKDFDKNLEIESLKSSSYTSTEV